MSQFIIVRITMLLWMLAVANFAFSETVPSKLVGWLSVVGAVLCVLSIGLAMLVQRAER